jgi:hypothetical protein
LKDIANGPLQSRLPPVIKDVAKVLVVEFFSCHPKDLQDDNTDTWKELSTGVLPLYHDHVSCILPCSALS